MIIFLLLSLALVSPIASYSFATTNTDPSYVTSLNSKGSYPIIFEDAGKLALSNAFIHILIPFNLTLIDKSIRDLETLLASAVAADHSSFTAGSWYDNLVSVNEDKNIDVVNFRTHLQSVKEAFLSVCSNLPDSKGTTLDKSLFLRNPAYLPIAPLKNKRSVTMLLPFLRAAVGTFWGVFGKQALTSLMSKVATGQRPANVLLSLPSQLEDSASAIMKKISSSISRNHAIIETNREYFRMYPVYAESVRLIEQQVAKVIKAIQQLHSHRLSIDLLSHTEMTRIHQAIVKFASNHNIHPLTHGTADYFQLETSYVRDGFDVTAILHVPCAGGNELLSFFASFLHQFLFQ